MANSRIMLACRHCGEATVIGTGCYGEYTPKSAVYELLSVFFDKHRQGICIDDIDCSDNARNHFVILEEFDNLEAKDIVDPVRCGDCKRYIKALSTCSLMGVKMKSNDFCSYGDSEEDTE